MCVIFIVYTSIQHNNTDWATHCVADETRGERAAQSIRDKCVEYLDRAEQLKEYLSKKDKSPPAKPVKESDNKGWDIMIKVWMSQTMLTSFSTC